MAKKGFGKFVVLAAAAGAAAAGISYLRKYKSFNDELEEEFHDFEGGEENDDDLFEEEETVSITVEEEPGVQGDKKPEEAKDADKDAESESSGESTDPRASRKYIPLNVSKDELKLAAKDMVSAAGEIAGAAKSVLKDAAVILGDTAHEAAVAAKESAQIARAKLSERAEMYRNRQQEEAASAQGENPEPAFTAEDVATSPGQEDAPAKEEGKDEQEKASQETAAAQAEPFIPKEPAGAASLETDSEDSVLEVVNPEDTQKTVLETEMPAGGELDVEELEE